MSSWLEAQWRVSSTRHQVPCNAMSRCRDTEMAQISASLSAGSSLVGRANYTAAFPGGHPLWLAVHKPWLELPTGKM